MADLDTLTLILLILAGLAAGWVDAVVGGGGLIQLPAMMLVPGITPVQGLATNKIASVMGTSVAAVTYTRRVKTDMRTALPLAGMAFLGVIVGAVIATYIPEEAFTPILLVVLIVVGAFTVFKRRWACIRRSADGAKQRARRGRDRAARRNVRRRLG